MLDADACASSCPQVLRVRSCSCGFYGSVVLHSMPKPMIACPLARRSCASDRAHVVFVGRWSCTRCSMPTIARSIVLMWFLWVGGLVFDARCRRFRVLLPAGLARPIHLMWFLWVCGLALDARCSMPMPMLMLMLMIARPLASRSLWICGLARPLARRSCASDPPHVVFWSGLAHSIVLMWFLLVGGLALDAEADDGASTCPQVFVDLWSCASTCPKVLRVRSTSCGFLVWSCASTCPQVLRVLWVGGLALESEADADADADDCASTCPQVFVDLWSCASTCQKVLRVLWVPLLPKGRARTASVSKGAPSGSTYKTTHLRVACACLLVFVVFVVFAVVSVASLHNVRRRPPMDARSLQADGNQNSRMRAYELIGASRTRFSAKVGQTP